MPNPQLLARARQAMAHQRGLLRDTEVIGIADFSQASGEERFFLLHTASGQVTSFHVSHGRGSDPYNSGFVHQFSDEPGSKASSSGAYVTGDFYYGKYGRSMKLRGLEPTNMNAEARSIVIHSAPYAEPEVVDRFGKLGRSEGCFAFSQASHREVMERLGPGRLLYCGKFG
ncbi:MAG TPA: murein L,D-transpeptidase catalytic domain family protein [Allosphingosinicella sp.]|nr:murein L,D-transpeptidase catalytic domain family protein [Allosphingosinicella sp.]